MDIAKLLSDKSLKPKQKTELLGLKLISKELSIQDLLAFAEIAKGSAKATCVEALESATRQDTSIANEKCLAFACNALTDKAPRVKWESAKVIGNIAGMFPGKLAPAVKNLLINTESDGTVVRWAAAFALGEILKLNTRLNKELLPTVEAICNRENNNGVKKKYLDALKKIKKSSAK